MKNGNVLLAAVAGTISLSVALGTNIELGTHPIRFITRIALSGCAGFLLLSAAAQLLRHHRDEMQKILNAQNTSAE